MRRLEALVHLMFLVMAGCRTIAYGIDYYVAQQDPRASNANPGTRERPFKTLGKACQVAMAGDTVYIRQGVYREPLIPKHSGEKGKPIVFRAYANDVVVIKGSEVVAGFQQEGPNLWVKRPWREENYWEDWMKEISVAPYGASAKVDQVFVNERPLQWVPSRAELKPGCFVWRGSAQGGELVICPPEGVGDLNQALVEVPVRANVLGAWEGDPGGLADVRGLRRSQPQHEWAQRQWPEIHYIHIKGLRCRHAAHTLNRAGVRLDGDHWLLEDCIVEFMNAIGIATCGDYGVVRRCVANHDNTFLVSGGNSRLIFGQRRFTSAEAFNASAANAQGNRSLSDLAQLDQATAARLNDAFKRILNALRVADAGLDIGAPSVRLEAIWHLGGPGKATGYWIRAEREHYLLLDMAAPAEVRLTGSGTPVLWDFPVLRAPVRAPLARVGEVLQAQVEGPCALIVGLGDDARPAAG